MVEGAGGWRMDGFFRIGGAPDRPSRHGLVPIGTPGGDEDAPSKGGRGPFAGWKLWQIVLLNVGVALVLGGTAAGLAIGLRGDDPAASPPPPPPSPPKPPPPPAVADACTDPGDADYAANNICDDWGSLTVSSDDPVENWGSVWWSYDYWHAYYDQAGANKASYPSGDSSIVYSSPDFNSNGFCEDGMGAPTALTGTTTLPENGYWIVFGITGIYRPGCGRSVTIGARRYEAPDAPTRCHFFYAPCPQGGDCADCGRGYTFGHGDGVTYASSPQQVAGPTGRRLEADGSIHWRLPPLRNESIVAELVELVRAANASGTLLGMRMPPVFHALVRGAEMEELA